MARTAHNTQSVVSPYGIPTPVLNTVIDEGKQASPQHNTGWKHRDQSLPNIVFGKKSISDNDAVLFQFD